MQNPFQTHRWPNAFEEEKGIGMKPQTEMVLN